MKYFFSFLLCFLAITSYCQNTINWKGHEWIKKQGEYKPCAPGCSNWWSDSKDNIEVIDDELYLRIAVDKNIPGQMNCAEVYLPASMGYGEYICYTKTNIDALDSVIVAAFFLYDNDTAEIDIEFSFWDWKDQNPPGWYILQPCHKHPENCRQFPFKYNEGNWTTHKIFWNQDGIFFRSYNGFYPTLPGPSHLIYEWYYTGNYNILPGKERLHINFWLNLKQKPLHEINEFIIHDIVVPDTSNAFQLLQTSEINGPNTIYPGQKRIQFEVDKNPEFKKYIWSYSGKGFSIVSGEFTNSITVNFSEDASSGILMVRPEDKNGRLGFPRIMEVYVVVTIK